MFSLRSMSNGSHTLTAGEELVEWEAVKDHVHSTRVAAILGGAMLFLIGIPSLYLLYGAPHPQKIAAVSEAHHRSQVRSRRHRYRIRQHC